MLWPKKNSCKEFDNEKKWPNWTTFKGGPEYSNRTEPTSPLPLILGCELAWNNVWDQLFSQPRPQGFSRPTRFLRGCGEPVDTLFIE